MHSLRTKITLLTVCAIIAALTVTTFFGVTAIRNLGNSSSRQILFLLCETGEKNLDAYFQSVEQSVEMVSSYVESDLENTEADQLGSHIDRVRVIFEKMANKTNGVLTYYYRIDPAISETEKGFWYVSQGGDGFREHEVTDITLYNTEDTSALVWFTVPKATGRSIWLPPYVTENLNTSVISYNVPIYWSGQFIGVVGIEIDYSTLVDQVENISLYENGYSFILDAEGNIIYHPYMDAPEQTGQIRPLIPEGLLSGDTNCRYTWDGVDKQAVWLPLHNGMRLYVTVPVSEINESWQLLANHIFAVSVVLLIVFVLLAMRITNQIIRPLTQLTETARQVSEGNYDFQLDYSGNNEVGILAHAFNQLISHLKIYISDLNSLAYADALTSVHNKGAYDIQIRQLQTQINDSAGSTEFAVGVFDCDNLKMINDQYGHEKGDIYLKTASALICRVFQHSPVFRTGGDEFTVLMENEDYQNRENLKHAFEERSAEVSAAADAEWEQVHVSFGLAVFDARNDKAVEDVVRRADKLMYENKRRRKVGRQTQSPAGAVS